MVIVYVFIFVAVAVALTPEFNKAVNMAQSSWPEGSSILSLVPSPIEFAIIVLVLIIFSIAAYVASQLTQ